MKFTRTLLTAAAAAAFVLPAAAQNTQDPAPPTQQAEQPAATQTAQPQPDTAAPAQQPAEQAAPAQNSSPPRAAAADLAVGAQVLGPNGQPVGTIAQADATGAVVSTGSAQGRLNLDAFFKDDRGLLIGYTRAQFEAAVTGQGGPETDEDDPPATEQPAATQEPAAAEQPAAAEEPAPAADPER